MSGSQASLPESPMGLASFLRAQRAQILAEWERAARRLSGAARLSQPTLINFIPSLLDRIADLVESLLGDGTADLPVETAERHALDRLEEGFDLGEVVVELSLLRDCIHRLWQGRPGGTAQEHREHLALAHAVDQVIVASVDRFTEARDRILRSLDRVSTTALEARTLDELLQQLLVAFREEVPAVDTVAILLREGDVVRVRAASGLEEDVSIGLSVPMGEGFVGKVAAEKRPLQLCSAATHPLVRSEVIRSRGVKALYGVPLVDGGEVIGVAHMGSLTAEEFSHQDRVLFGSMASRATTGIYQQVLRDNTERRTRELEESEQKFKATFESAAVGIAHVALDGSWLRLNRKYCEILGYTQDELMQRGLRDVTHPDEAGADLEGLRQLIAGERDGFTGERRYIRGDGQVVWVDLSVGVARDADGRPLYFVATVKEISKRKETEAALMRALGDAEAGRRLLDALMENIPIGITIADAPDVRIRAVSRYGREMSARSAESLKGIPVVHHPEDWGLLRADGTPARPGDLPLSRATQRGEHVRAEEWILQRPDGTRVPILCTAGPVRDHHGHIIGGVIGWQDISEKKAAESLLREREERLRMVIDTTGIGAFDFYPKTGRLEWSAYAKHHFGLPADAEVDFEVFLRGLHPDDRERVHETIQDAFRPGGSGEYATEYRTIGLADGKERWISARGQATFDSEGNPERFVGFTLDITEQKRAEEQLRESDRRKDEFIAMLGHELRNPLAAIRNATELIKLRAPDDGRVQRAHGVLQRQSSHMARLIDGLLEVSRIARGKIQLDRETLDVRKVIEGVVQDRMAQVEARGLQLSADLPSKPLWVWGDHVRLAQVLDNLVSNAIKFTDPSGNVDVTLEEEDGCATIRVRDTGVGIRQEILERLFDPFQQEAQDIARAAGGLGLGLAVARGLVELHGGTIRAHSAGPGAGAEFLVRLPLGSAPRGLQPENPVGRAPSRRILVVEDNRDAAQMLKELLELSGHEVTLAATGGAALDSLREHGADVVLCDLGLPGMTGYDFARAVRSDSALTRIPLVALTGYGQPEDHDRTTETGFDDHLTKPVDLAAVDAALAKLAPVGERT